MTQNWQNPVLAQGAVFVGGQQARGIVGWIRFERRWWTWLTSPYKSMFPWGMGIRLRASHAILWMPGRRHSDKQHAHYLLKQEFSPDYGTAEPEASSSPSYIAGPPPYHHPRNRKARL